jgi:hypothetical protein
MKNAAAIDIRLSFSIIIIDPWQSFLRLSVVFHMLTHTGWLRQHGCDLYAIC